VPRGSDPATALARLELYREVALFAAELKATFSGREIWRVWQTKAEREQREVDMANQRRESRLNALCEGEHTKGMRKGASKELVQNSEDLRKNVPAGTYTCDGCRGGKTYKVTVTHCTGCLDRVIFDITRIS